MRACAITPVDRRYVPDEEPTDRWFAAGRWILKAYDSVKYVRHKPALQTTGWFMYGRAKQAMLEIGY